MQHSLSYMYTPLWTAPEVLNGAYTRYYHKHASFSYLASMFAFFDATTQNCLSKIDIWSLGCVIIEMASGMGWFCALTNTFVFFVLPIALSVLSLPSQWLLSLSKPLSALMFAIFNKTQVSHLGLNVTSRTLSVHYTILETQAT